jgi:DNA-binding NarL/FixJ family response regulator
VVAQGISRLLEDEPDIEVVACVASGQEALDQALESGVDIVLMDRHTPRMNAIVVTEALKDAAKGIRVAVLSAEADVADAVRVLRSGAGAYLSKRSTIKDVLHAIREAAAGRRYVGAEFADAVLATLIDPAKSRDPLAQLTPREQDVVRYLAKGRRGKEIARDLALSRKTIDTYRARAMDKLQVRDLAGLIRFAIRQGMVPLD